MRSESYAAFIMTYQRVELLTDTIEKIFRQTLPPSKILIVDNDPEKTAKDVLSRFSGKIVEYYSVGHNSGPAGAAYYGLKTLFNEGWEWVLWMDDNDPPQFDDVIEHIFEIPRKYDHPEKIGMIGAVGVCFDKRKAKTVRVPDGSLKEILEVDNIAGNSLPIIHRRVFEAGICPDEKLFFGFEELDYSLSIKRAGLSVLISGEELFRHRQRAGRLNFKRKLYKEKNPKSLWREYYTTRNVIYILKYKEHAGWGALVLSIKALAKCIFGFRYGWNYGWKNMNFLVSGIKDGWGKTMGYKTLS